MPKKPNHQSLFLVFILRLLRNVAMARLSRRVTKVMKESNFARSQDSRTESSEADSNLRWCTGKTALNPKPSLRTQRLQFRWVTAIKTYIECLPTKQGRFWVLKAKS